MMGAQSNLGVSARRGAVLALLRREEPAKVLARQNGRKKIAIAAVARKPLSVMRAIY